MVDLNIENFKAQFDGGARPTLFRVSGNWPGIVAGGASAFSVMTKGASLPASVLGVIEVPYLGRKLKIPGDRTFDPWTVTIVNNENFRVRDSFEKWSNAINSHYGNVSSLKNPTDYFSDFNIDQLDREGRILKRITMQDAFPSNVSEIEVNMESNDMIEEFTVELTYTSWTNTVGQNGLTTDQAEGSSSLTIDLGINVNL
jgi:hypothetical protein